MSKPITSIAIPDEVVLSKIYVIRDVKVMLDRDLAELYGVETKYLKRQVKRNLIRFPEDFMFELTGRILKIGGANLSPPKMIEWGFVMLLMHLRKMADL